MKLLHLGDLHIGKKVNDFLMLEDQSFVLNQAIDLIKKESVNAVLISGDVFDKPIPSVAALELFSDFLEKINELNLKIFIISGNHDNLERLSYLSDFLKRAQIYISKTFTGKIECIELDNSTNIYLMPYLYPALIRKHFENEKIDNYNDAFKVLIEHTKINKSKINILLAHQFVIGTDSPILSDSEQKSVGGVDNISYDLFKDFDYTALGHLHCPQDVGSDRVRYCGSILKYSYSELNQKKYFNIVNIADKNNISIEKFDIKPLHELKEYKGHIDYFLSEEFYSKIDTKDYIHFILEDEYVLDAKKKLSTIYPNIMLLEFDNKFTQSLERFEFKEGLKNKSMLEHFRDFYQIQYGVELDDEKEKIVQNCISELNKEKV